MSSAEAPPPPQFNTSGVLDATSLAVRVKVALEMTDGLNDSGLSVETVNGLVILSGKLPDYAQHKRALDIARGVEGVRDVESHIAVGES